MRGNQGPSRAPGLGGRLRGVVSRVREPVGPLPAPVGSELGAEVPDTVVHRREPLAAPGRPCVVREVHRVLVAVDLDGLREGVVLVGVVHEPARIAAPHVPTRSPPSTTHSASTLPAPPACAIPKVKTHASNAGRNPRHRPDERVAVRGVGDRAVDDPAYPALAEQGAPGPPRPRRTHSSRSRSSGVRAGRRSPPASDRWR